MTVDAPIAEQIDIRVPFVVIGAGGIEGEISLPGNRTPIGYSAAMGPFRSPEANPDLTVVLYPRARVMDQTYRIVVAWEGGEGAARQTWTRYEGGVAQESIRIEGEGASLTVVFLDGAGRETVRLPATEVSGTILARGAQRMVVIVRRDGFLAYTSMNYDGTNRWDAEFRP